jgi:hypothetical protein
VTMPVAFRGFLQPTSTSWPARQRPMAALRPAIPAPTTATLSLHCVVSMIDAGTFFRIVWFFELGLAILDVTQVVDDELIPTVCLNLS